MLGKVSPEMSEYFQDKIPKFLHTSEIELIHPLISSYIGAKAECPNFYEQSKQHKRLACAIKRFEVCTEKLQCTGNAEIEAKIEKHLKVISKTLKKSASPKLVQHDLDILETRTVRFVDHDSDDTTLDLIPDQDNSDQAVVSHELLIEEYVELESADEQPVEIYSPSQPTDDVDLILQIPDAEMRDLLESNV